MRRPIDIESVWSRLSQVDVSKHCETKGGFTYLSWSWAWSYVKDNYPDATFEKHLFEGLPYMIDPQGFAFVQVTVTIQGLPATEILPVLNHSNKPIKNPDSFAVNTALQRCLVKAIAFHGLGHYVYAGEDLPPGSEPKPMFNVAEVIDEALLKTSRSEPTVVVENIEDTLTVVPDAPGETQSSLANSLLSCLSIYDLKNWERDNDGEVAWIEENDATAFDSLKAVHKRMKEKIDG